MEKGQKFVSPRYRFSLASLGLNPPYFKVPLHRCLHPHLPNQAELHTQPPVALGAIHSSGMSSFDSLSSTILTTYNSPREVQYIRDNESPIFSGGQGAVYRVTKGTSRLFSQSRQVYAIKEIQASDQCTRDNVSQEIELLRRCDHPNILKLENVYRIESTPSLRNSIFLVTRPWAPVSLHRFLQNVAGSPGTHSDLCSWYTHQKLEPWPRIIWQCMEALQRLHTRSPHPIRHKDLKPESILLLDETRDSCASNTCGFRYQ